MKFLILIALMKYGVSFIYEEKPLDSKQKWRLMFDDSTPSKLACVQKALYFKGEASYDDGRCKVVRKDDAGKDVELTTKTFIHKVGNIDTLNVPTESDKWKLEQTIIGDKTAIKSNTFVTKLAPFKDEFRLSFQVKLSSYNNKSTGGISIFEFLDDSNPEQMFIKVILTHKNNLRVIHANQRATSNTISPFNEWSNVNIVQERKRMRYSQRITFNNVDTHTFDLGSQAPVWNDVQVYVSGAKMGFADGFVREVLLYKKIFKDSNSSPTPTL